jgi:hypothetical protein
LRATPFSNQFGLQNVYGVAKPVYRAFELLNNAGDKRAAVTSSASVGDERKRSAERGGARKQAPVAEAMSVLCLNLRTSTHFFFVSLLFRMALCQCFPRCTATAARCASI